MFYLFTRHHWTPEMYYGMGHGGRDLTWGMALLGLGGLALFLVGMKYGDRAEEALLRRFRHK